MAIKKLSYVIFLTRKTITAVRKITINFRQVSLKGLLLLVSVLECFGKIFQVPEKKLNL